MNTKSNDKSLQITVTIHCTGHTDIQTRTHIFDAGLEALGYQDKVYSGQARLLY